MFDEAWIEATPPDRKRLIPTRREVRVSPTREIKMTRERIAANQANGNLSHGPAAAPQGRERIRAANLHHRFYSQAETVALTCLGKDRSADRKGGGVRGWRRETIGRTHEPRNLDRN